MKKLVTTVLAATLSASMSMTAFAGQWMFDSDHSGWWCKEDDGSYPADAWVWLDDDHDGIEECYCFDSNGYLLFDGYTPDGYVVGKGGYWTSDDKSLTRPAIHATTDPADPNQHSYCRNINGHAKFSFGWTPAVFIMIDWDCGDYYETCCPISWKECDDLYQETGTWPYVPGDQKWEYIRIRKDAVVHEVKHDAGSNTDTVKDHTWKELRADRPSEAIFFQDIVQDENGYITEFSYKY